MISLLGWEFFIAGFIILNPFCCSEVAKLETQSNSEVQFIKGIELRSVSRKRLIPQENKDCLSLDQVMIQLEQLFKRWEKKNEVWCRVFLETPNL